MGNQATKNERIEKGVTKTEEMTRITAIVSVLEIRTKVAIQTLSLVINIITVVIIVLEVYLMNIESGEERGERKTIKETTVEKEKDPIVRIATDLFDKKCSNWGSNPRPSRY